MVGFGTAAGVRASLTLVTIGVLSRLEWGAHLSPRFMWLQSWVAIMVFILLLIFEATFDKVPLSTGYRTRSSCPTASSSAPWPAQPRSPWLAGLRHRHGGRGRSRLVGTVGQARHPPAFHVERAYGGLISMIEDMFAFFGAALTSVFSLVGYAVFAATFGCSAVSRAGAGSSTRACASCARASARRRVP